MIANSVVFYKKKESKDMSGGGVVRCGGRGCLCGPMLGHPFPLRDQLLDAII